MTQAFPWLLLPVLWGARNRARRRERGDSLRAALFGGIGLARGRGDLRHRLLAHLAAARLRGARRLPRPPRPRLALPHLPLLRGLQRGGERALHLLPLRGPAPAPRRARSRPTRLFHSRFARTVGQSALDGGRLRPPGAARDRPRPLRAPRLLPAGGGHGRPLRRDPLRGRCGGHPRPGERLSRPSRARHPDAHGAAVRGRDRRAPALPAPRAAARRPVAARRHRLLRDPAVAGHPVPALVLGRGEPVRRPARAGRTSSTSGRCGPPPSPSPSSPGPPTGAYYFAAWSKAQEARKARFTRLALLEPLRAPPAARRPPGARCWSRT